MILLLNQSNLMKCWIFYCIFLVDKFLRYFCKYKMSGESLTREDYPEKTFQWIRGENAK